MEYIEDGVCKGLIPIGTPLSSSLLAWVENPWRRHMLRTHLQLVAMGTADQQYVDGLVSLAETHNIEGAQNVLPSTTYVPRLYAKADIINTTDARGLEWFTEEQVAMHSPSLNTGGLSMALVTPSMIMASGAAATVVASQKPMDSRWHVVQGPYQLFPLPNLGMREITKDWGMLPLLTPGAHVVAPANLLQLARKTTGSLPFRIAYSSSARVLVDNFGAWYEKARESGVIVCIHRLHPRDIEILVENEVEACARASNARSGRWLGPFGHFAAREMAELLLSKGVTATGPNEHEGERPIIDELEAAFAALRHHLLKTWKEHFCTSWMGGQHFPLNPLVLKMSIVVASLGRVGLQRMRKGHDPGGWLIQLEECVGSFADVQLWYGQLSDSPTHQQEVELACETGPYPVGRFVAEWGKIHGLKTWLEDADGEMIELNDEEQYDMKIFSNRPSKKVFCSASRNVDMKEHKCAAAAISLKFLEWLRIAEATFEVGCDEDMPVFRRRGGTWHEFRNRDELRSKLDTIDGSTILSSIYESHLMPSHWNPETQAALIEMLGLITRNWSAPFAPLCVLQFIQAVREVLGFRDGGTWEEIRGDAHHLAGAQLEYMVDIWWPEAFHVYRTEMSWVLEMDHGIGLVTTARDGDERIHASVGFETVRYASELPKRLGWALQKDGMVVGTPSLEQWFAAPNVHSALRLARPHCAAEAWAASDLKDLLEDIIGVTFELHADSQGASPMIELCGPKRRLKRVLRWIPGFTAAVFGYSPPPALTSEEHRSSGKCWIWTQAQLRSLAKDHCAELYERVGLAWDGKTMALARAAADAVVVWGLVEHGLRCAVTNGGCWIPEGRRAETGFCWDQALELGPVAAMHRSHGDIEYLVTDDKAMRWTKCVVSNVVGVGTVEKAHVTPEGGSTIVPVGSGEKQDGAFQRPLGRVEVGGVG